MAHPPTSKKLRILFPAAECVPFAKTGGLADVAGSLPIALAALGHDVRLALPLYRQVRQSGRPIFPTSLRLRVPVGADVLEAPVWESRLTDGGPRVYFIQQDGYFDRPELYKGLEGDFQDNDRRYAFFSRAVLELGRALDEPWDILHVHDWHTGLIPAYLKTLYAGERVYAKTRCLMTIHNLAYQGLFSPESFSLTGLPPQLYSSEGLEFYGQLNFLKAGLVFADWVNAVSPTYSREIQTPELGFGLDGVLRARKISVSGILNGLDDVFWDPRTDPLIPLHFDAAALETKERLKERLLEEQMLFELPGAPLIGIISRLDDQKGFDIFAEAAEALLEQNIQWVVLGVGAKRYHDLFLKLKARHVRKLSVNLDFSESLAHRIYAGADMFLMPSRFEPCGLSQMISLRYGTIPIVRHTGGLADTIFNYDGHTGNGFSFKSYSGEALLRTVRRAVEVYHDRDAWRQLTLRAMESDFSWNRSAQDYVDLYRHLLRPPSSHPAKKNLPIS